MTGSGTCMYIMYRIKFEVILNDCVGMIQSKVVTG